MDTNERPEFDKQSAAIAHSFHSTFLKYAPGAELEDSPLLQAVVKKLIIDGVIEPGKAII